ncbi:MAG TPA: MFS transporter [Sphingobium sp.]|nr:MFS transporter [Sphingobium sp.]
MVIKRPYYGWQVVAMSIISLMIVLGNVFSSFGLFVVPVSQEFGLSRANMNSALILLSLGGAVAAPIIGRLVDKVPMKPFMLFSALGLGACLVGLGLSRSLWLDMLILLVPLPIVVQGAGNLTMPTLIARWFQAQRGRAMVLGMMGLALGAAVMPPILGFLSQSYGWRAALVISGCVSGLILFGLFSTVRDRPGPGEMTDLPPAGSATAESAGPARVFAVGELLRSGQFWLIVVSAALALGVNQGFQVSLVPLALDNGFDMVVGASLISAAGAGSFGGKLLIAIFADRVRRETLLACIFALMGLLSCIPLLSQSYPVLMATALCFGSTGALMPVFYALLADRFGAASFGTVQGLSLPVIAVVGAVAIRFSGEVFDKTGKYDLMFAVFCAVQIVAATMILSTRYFARPLGRAVAA